MSIIGVTTIEELIGNKEFLKIREVTLPKTNNIDLSSLIEINERDDDRSWIKHPKNAHDNGKVLEDDLLNDPTFISAIKNHKSIDKNLMIINTDRSVCAKISGELAQLHGNSGFKGILNIKFTGAAGQSFGAFLLKGMHIKLVGEANDYVCKGMNGGILTVVPKTIDLNSSNQVILGNTCLYGATGGKLYALGKSGERFAVRNSGATAVTEGAGDHCCEYMTGGKIVILGPTGRNIGAGMTGGVTFLIDEENQLEKKVNKEIVSIYKIHNSHQEKIIKDIISDYFKHTGSLKALKLLNDWDYSIQIFKMIVPPSEEQILLIDQSSKL